MKKVNLPPLADRMRPRNLDEFVGQDHLVGPNGPIRKMMEQAEIPSMIFWGPPGTGKTTLARIIADTKGYAFLSFSAVLSGVKEVREAIEKARIYDWQGKRTILFVDEIHRFNKAQQDAFLPYIEKGTIILIGATTENPSFAVISPLLSRAIVYNFYKLTPAQIKLIINRALTDERGLKEYNPNVDPAAIDYIAEVADGDARIALNILEIAVLTSSDKNGTRHVGVDKIKEIVKEIPLLYDRKGEEYYNLISAFIKSLRGSDPDAALYWLARMIESGADPLYIARRMVILASEDIGNADPQALMLAVACKEAVEFVGLPECVLPLAQTAIYLALAPKSNTAMSAYENAAHDVKQHGSIPVPMHLRQAPTKWLKEWGYKKGYKYPHSYPEGITPQDYLPEQLKGHRYYFPKEVGFEAELKRRLDKIRKLMDRN
ncbi:replication-associated recombination protein A [candidate division WOR-3 bacterium]|nr:replication-associated recombination protein A [candidate division WOR-3 bacterium]